MKLQVFLFFVVVLAALVSVAVGMPQRGGGRGRGRGRGGPGNRLDTCITSRRINRDSVFYLLDEGDEECEDGLPESGTSLIVGSLADECAVPDEEIRACFLRRRTLRDFLVDEDGNRIELDDIDLSSYEPVAEDFRGRCFVCPGDDDDDDD